MPYNVASRKKLMQITLSMMKQGVVFLLLLMININVFATESSTSCEKWPAWFKPACQHLHQTWSEGKVELYATGYAWHNRYLYSQERLNTYNEAALGGGIGRGLYDKDGDWSSLFIIAFLDSHKNVEPLGGYGFLKMAHFKSDVNAGLGYTVFLTARPDIFHNIPFPGILPLVSLGYRSVSLFATYIPGAQGAGNVLFCFAKYRF
jgi:palmitoyl transferase